MSLDKNSCGGMKGQSAAEENDTQHIFAGEWQRLKL
jgi:hypothetical protein